MESKDNTNETVNSVKKQNYKFVKGKSGNPNGRPKGALCKKTIEKKIVEKEFKDRVLKSMGNIVNAQMNLAMGVQMLFKIETTEDAKGNITRSKPILVDNQIEIEEYLAGEYNGYDSDYYFITTAKPDNKAIDSLIDRTLGKAVNRTELSGPDGKDLGVILFPEAKNN